MLLEAVYNFKESFSNHTIDMMMSAKGPGDTEESTTWSNKELSRHCSIDRLNHIHVDDTPDQLSSERLEILEVHVIDLTYSWAVVFIYVLILYNIW